MAACNRGCDRKNRGCRRMHYAASGAHLAVLLGKIPRALDRVDPQRLGPRNGGWWNGGWRGGGRRRGGDVAQEAIANPGRSARAAVVARQCFAGTVRRPVRTDRIHVALVRVHARRLMSALLDIGAIGALEARKALARVPTCRMKHGVGQDKGGLAITKGRLRAVTVCVPRVCATRVDRARRRGPGRQRGQGGNRPPRSEGRGGTFDPSGCRRWCCSSARWGSTLHAFGSGPSRCLCSNRRTGRARRTRR